jgi:outer membrane protein assembly factor BamB
LEVHGQPNLRYASDNSRTRRVRLKIDGMAVSDLVTLLDQPGQQVAMGYKSPGTRIPMVAYLRQPGSESEDGGEEDAAAKKRKSRKRGKVNRAPKPELVWASELPALDPLSTKEGPTEFVAISQGYIAAMYSPKSGAPHLVCFSREGGQRLWDLAMPGRTSVVTGIEISGDRIYVTQWGRLDAFELERGSHVFAIGD